ncbi:integrase [Halomonas stenophila]|uniref:Integrase n=2 Tax=Halomonas stenophila TaxID=795312 RepID=A0A7W5HM63_9GAMM|nr:integrase [Halomonas stenophila]
MNQLAHYLRTQNVSGINIDSLAQWKVFLGSEFEYRLGAIRGLFYSWEQWGFKGVDESVVDWLEEQKIRGNVKGKAVRTWCPFSGPYSSTELGWILEWATDALREKEISYDTHAAIYLLATTGQRAVQLRKLRSKDIAASKKTDSRGSVENFVLSIPMAKERLAKKYRSEFLEKPINRSLYLVLANLRDRNIEKINSLLDEPMTIDEIKEIPLFPSWVRIKRFIKANGSSKRVFMGEHEARPNSFHITTHGFRDLIGYEYTRRCPLISEVTGEPLTLSSRRFRYTYGTNCAKMGLTGRALAYALGQRDNQNVNHYVETSPEIADRINELMEGPLTVIAQALAGTLVDSETDAVRGDDPRARIKTSSMENVGTCGSYEFCPSGWRSCYTCRRFQPWLDAPHEEALKEVLQSRKQMVEAGCSELVIHSSDRLVLAIRKVIELCEQRKNDLASGNAMEGECR